MDNEFPCPSCGTPARDASGDPETCAQCGYWWVPSADPHLRRLGPHELEIQNAPGDAVRGPFDRLDIRERLYKGLLTGEELVRPVGGRFTKLRTQPDFAEIIALKERGNPQPVLARRPPKDARPKVPAGGPGAEGEEQPSTVTSPIPIPTPNLTKQETQRLGSVAIITVAVGVAVVAALLLGYSMVVGG